jgi:dTDP-4-amino-4,6-dideoxygalactose transaminase
LANEKIPFNKPHITGKELEYVTLAHSYGHLSGDGIFTKRCHQWLEERTGCKKALLTHSCTAALEMAALLLDIEPGDEVIMPSFTFVSTANAFVLRGGVPVFVDIRADTLNLNEHLIEAAITSKTKAIVPVHYAGVACEMDIILGIAQKHGLKVVEDAAQGVMASYKGRALGCIGDIGAFSFHETKNVISGEGGALLVNDSALTLRAEVIREKGTNRSRFFRGEVDKYTWQEAGSSYLPSELVAAFLWAQLEHAKAITTQRITIWDHYHAALSALERQGFLRRPVVPIDCEHNAHMYYVLLNDQIDRQSVLSQLKQHNIFPVFHYVPLHSSPGGLRYGRVHGSMDVTNSQSEKLIRMPLWIGLSVEQQNGIVEVLSQSLARHL